MRFFLVSWAVLAVVRKTRERYCCPTPPNPDTHTHVPTHGWIRTAAARSRGSVGGAVGTHTDPFHPQGGQTLGNRAIRTAVASFLESFFCGRQSLEDSGFLLNEGGQCSKKESQKLNGHWRGASRKCKAWKMKSSSKGQCRLPPGL